jgi:hypothetical protein
VGRVMHSGTSQVPSYSYRQRYFMLMKYTGLSRC